MTNCYVIVKFGTTSQGLRESAELPCYPDEISDGTSARWSSQEILGRSFPISAYTGTGFRSISFSFDLHREMTVGGEAGGAGIGYTTDLVDNALRVLRKSVYPRYEQAGLSPPKTIFRFGDFRVGGYVKDLTYVWKKPIVDEKYQLCTVSVQLDQVPASVYGVDDLFGIYHSPTNPFYVDEG